MGQMAVMLDTFRSMGLGWKRVVNFMKNSATVRKSHLVNRVASGCNTLMFALLASRGSGSLPPSPKLLMCSGLVLLSLIRSEFERQFDPHAHVRTSATAARPIIWCPSSELTEPRGDLTSGSNVKQIGAPTPREQESVLPIA